MADNFDYFAHEADMGIIGRGSTIEEAFVQAAKAVFANMADLSKIQPLKTIHFEFAEPDIELALVEWLNRLIGEARANDFIFGQFTLNRNQDRWIGSATGEPWREDLERGTEVKGATLTMLSVKQHPDHWEARCVVDV